MTRTLTRLGLALVLAVLFGVSPAGAEETGVVYEPFAKIQADGVLKVKVDVTFPGTVPESITQTFATAVALPNDYQQRFVVSDLSSSDAKVTQSTTANTMVVTIAPQGKQKISFSYSVSGAGQRLADGSVDVTWALLQGLSVPVATFDAMVVPTTEFTLIDCAAGKPESLGGCGFYSGGMEGNRLPIFHDSNRAPGEVVQFTMRFPDGTVAPTASIHEMWNLQRAFSLEAGPLGVAAGLLLVGAALFYVLHRKFGVDAQVKATPTMVAQFVPVGPGQSEFKVLDEVRPGQVGTVLDERVDPADITATVLDLAIRGHLVIEELPRASSYATADWTLTRAMGTDELAEYEKTLLDAVAPVDAVIHLTQVDSSVASVIATVQSQLYAEVTNRGWFRGRPDLIRSRWFLGSVVGAVAATIVMLGLAAWTHFGVAGLVLIVLSVGMMFVAQAMPSRTESGTSLANGFDVLRGQLLTAPTDQWPQGAAYQEVSKILPYSVVLGGFERWLTALADADDDEAPDGDDLSWYKAPDDWHLRNLPDSLTNFILTMQGRIHSR